MARKKSKKKMTAAEAVSSAASLALGVLATGLVPYAAWNLYVSPVFRVLPMGYWRALGLGVALRVTTLMTSGEMVGVIEGPTKPTPLKRFLLSLVVYSAVVAFSAAALWILGKVIPKRPVGGNTFGPPLPWTSLSPAYRFS